MGMKITKVHSIISFNQKPWMAEFIKDNIKNRIDAKNKGLDFLVTIYKLLNNSVFGKTMENLDKRRNINLYTSKEINKIQKIISKPTFQGEKKFSDHLIAIETGNYEKLYNKPIYIGFSILELSKLQMYKFYYETLVPHFKDRISAHAQDTDSMFLLIKSPDVYKEIETHLKHLINSSGELFTYKDECGGDVMTKFIIIRAKQYAYETIKNKTVKKLKGIQKSVVKDIIIFRNYEDCIDDVEPIQFETVHSLRASKHVMYLSEQKKQSFFNFDDKRAILSDSITTIPHNFEKTKMNIIKNLNEINEKYNVTLTDLDIINTKIRYKELKDSLDKPKTLKLRSVRETSPSVSIAAKDCKDKTVKELKESFAIAVKELKESLAIAVKELEESLAIAVKELKQSRLLVI